MSFLNVFVSAPGQFRDGLLIGNPDAVFESEGSNIPASFDANEPSISLDGRTREQRLLVVMTNEPFEIAVVGPTETLETVTPLKAPPSAFASLAILSYCAVIPGGVTKIFVRSIDGD